MTEIPEGSPENPESILKEITHDFTLIREDGEGSAQRLTIRYDSRDVVKRESSRTSTKNVEGDHVMAQVSLPNGNEERMFCKFFNADDELYLELYKHDYGPKKLAEKYRWLNRNGFPVVPDLFVEGNVWGTALMTDMTEGGRNVIIDSGHPLNESKVVIQNIDEIKQQIEEVGKRAFSLDHGMMLGSDAFAVIVTPDGIGRLYLLDIGVNTYPLSKEMQADDHNQEAVESNLRKCMQMLSLDSKL